jgi:hypothetical protein
MKLRSRVLICSLNIEDFLSGVLALLFRFPKDSSKTLGNTGSSLSFKAKADLLRDIDRIPDETYKDLVLFMEIRNQLMHNLASDSLCKVLNRNSKVNAFLKLNPEYEKEHMKLKEGKVKEKLLYKCFTIFIGKLIAELNDLMVALQEEIDMIESINKAAIEKEAISHFTTKLGVAIDDFSKEFDEKYSRLRTTKLSRGYIKKGILVHFKKGLEED